MLNRLIWLQPERNYCRKEERLYPLLLCRTPFARNWWLMILLGHLPRYRFVKWDGGLLFGYKLCWGGWLYSPNPSAPWNGRHYIDFDDIPF